MSFQTGFPLKLLLARNVTPELQVKAAIKVTGMAAAEIAGDKDAFGMARKSRFDDRFFNDLRDASVSRDIEKMVRAVSYYGASGFPTREARRILLGFIKAGYDSYIDKHWERTIIEPTWFVISQIGDPRLDRWIAAQALVYAMSEMDPVEHRTLSSYAERWIADAQRAARTGLAMPLSIPFETWNMPQFEDFTTDSIGMYAVRIAQRETMAATQNVLVFLYNAMRGRGASEADADDELYKIVEYGILTFPPPEVY